MLGERDMSKIKRLLYGAIFTTMCIPCTGVMAESANSNIKLNVEVPNVLELTLDTDSINFGDYTGMDTKRVNIVATVSSTLPYNLKATLLDDIKTEDGKYIIPMDKLALYGEQEDEVQFSSKGQTKVIDANCPQAWEAEHSIAIEVWDGDVAHQGSYKANLRIEAEQV